MKKSIWTLACLSYVGILTPPIHADTVQIGIYSISSTISATPFGPITLFETSIQNLTDSTMTVSKITFTNGGSLIPFGLSISPGDTLGGGALFSGSTVAPDAISFSGVLSSLNFAVGGTQYTAASLNWTTSALSTDQSGSVAITITATPVLQAVPEPSSVLLLGIVLAGLAVHRTRSGSVGARLARGSE